MCTLEQYCGLLNFDKPFKPDQFYRFVSAIFVHSGLLHLGINCYMLLQTGVPMETAYGWTRIATIYFLSGIGGFLFGANVISQVPSVGASGAIFGIHGCVLLDLLLHFELVKNRWKELGKLFGLSFLSLLMGLLPYIDNFAHIGGFVIGILSGLVLFPSISFSKEDQNRKLLARIIALPILIGIFAGLIVWFYSPGQKSCSWCKYLDCIPWNGWCDGYV
jgi:membrane associated rhomboid family serine protease